MRDGWSLAFQDDESRWNLRESIGGPSASAQIHTGLNQKFQQIYMLDGWKWHAAAAIYGDGSDLPRTQIEADHAVVFQKADGVLTSVLVYFKG